MDLKLTQVRSDAASLEARLAQLQQEGTGKDAQPAELRAPLDSPSPPPPRRLTCSCFTTWTIIAFFSLYLAVLVYGGVQVLFPNYFIPTHDEHNKPLATIEPLWSPYTQVSLSVSLFVPGQEKDRSVQVWTIPSFALSPHVALNQTYDTLASLPGWVAASLQADETIVARYSLAHAAGSSVSVDVPLVVRRRPLKRLARPSRKLVEGWPVLGDLFPSKPKPPEGQPAGNHSGVVGFWLPKCTVYLVWDFTHWPYGGTPVHVARALRLVHGKYLPILSGVQMGAQLADMIQINTTHASNLALSLGLDTMSLPQWMFYEMAEDGLGVHRQLGALQEEDLDDVKRMITSMTPAVLGLSILVAAVHIMFDILAFKAEIGYWAKLDSARGVSQRSLLLSLLSQAIIFLFLRDQEATKLVLVPTGLGVLVSVWKLVKSIRLFKAEAPQLAQIQAESDALALRVMGAVLAPIVISYCFLTLVRDEYPGWYSYLVSSLAACVYAGGFALMTPQVFLNWKLKSVAHLAWDALMYRAFNTFIDDWFAFIMPMPNMHRLMTLRDDVVFLVYLYQRHIYPVRREEDKHKTE